MKNARHVIAVTLMATAICADRGLPSRAAEPEQARFATRLMERLCVNLRQSVRTARICQPRRFGLHPVEVLSPRIDGLSVTIGQPPLSPFQFRLPPPIA